MFHRFIAVNTLQIHAKIAIKKQRRASRHICKSEDDKVFWLSYQNNENIQISVEIANTNHRVITSMR